MGGALLAPKQAIDDSSLDRDPLPHLSDRLGEEDLDCIQRLTRKHDQVMTFVEAGTGTRHRDLLGRFAQGGADPTRPQGQSKATACRSPGASKTMLQSMHGRLALVS